MKRLVLFAAAMAGLLVGAGTLITVEQHKAAKAAGAVFGVAPGFDPLVRTVRG